MKTKYRVLFTLFITLCLVLLFKINQNKTGSNDQESLSAQQLLPPSSLADNSRLETREDIQDISGEPSDNDRPENLGRSFQDLRNYCLNRYPNLAHLIPTAEEINQWKDSGALKRSWLNIHLKQEDNTVIRVRRFLDDGPNGTYERLVVFEEDDTGFPEIRDIPESHRVNPSEQIVAQYLALGVSIFTDEGLVGDIDDKNVFLELINGQVTRVDVSVGSELLNCQSEY